jgi:adenosylcobinamide kinase/adenosylcobinamide-phosphate guanylyltransferase
MAPEPAPPAGGLTLVLGGVRSGKSAAAERLTRAAGTAVTTYIATARAGDAEMAVRVQRHRARRAGWPGWRTVEEPRLVPAAVAASVRLGAVLVEDVPLWLTAMLTDPDGPADDAVLAAVADLASAARSGPGPVVVVSAEAGLGLVPPNPLARRYTDRLGEANQVLAAAADEVVLVVAGLPHVLKSAGRPRGG